MINKYKISVSCKVLNDEFETFELDISTTIYQFKKIIENKYFVPPESFYICNSKRIFKDNEIFENILNEITNLQVIFRLFGGTCRYKKASSKMRWKHKLKRMRRLKRIRRRMRNRAR